MNICAKFEDNPSSSSQEWMDNLKTPGYGYHVCRKYPEPEQSGRLQRKQLRALKNVLQFDAGCRERSALKVEATGRDNAAHRRQIAWNPSVCFVYDQHILLPTLYIMTEPPFATVKRKKEQRLPLISRLECGTYLS